MVYLELATRFVGLMKPMLLALILFTLTAFWNKALQPELGAVSPWKGSPLAVMGSRLLYSRSQAVWHHGVEEESHAPAAPPSIGGYVYRVYANTKPAHEIAHEPRSSLEELAKNILVIEMMRKALEWDPRYWVAALDLSFLLSSELGRSDLAAQVLAQALEQPDLPVQGRLSLLVDYFQTLALRQGRKKEAWGLAPELEKSVSDLEKMRSNDFEINSLINNAKSLIAASKASVTPPQAQPIRSRFCPHDHEELESPLKP